MWLVVGLGNPGSEYAQTRHNAGFRLVQRVAASWGVKRWGRAPRAKTASSVRNGEKIFLVLPQTFMNRSGAAVLGMMTREWIPPDRVIVVFDDLDIPLGEIRVRKSGSPGTHKGVQSVVKDIGAAEFRRIRIGIGPLPPGADATEFVLSPFDGEEKPLLEKSFDEAEEALDLVLAGDADVAMARFNHRKKAL